MTYELMLGLLKNCGDGEQLLTALNAIATANDDSVPDTNKGNAWERLFKNKIEV